MSSPSPQTPPDASSMPAHVAAWRELGFGMMVHFSINTFHDVEWSDGTLAAASFAPSDFDPDQWCAAAAAAGMRYILPVTKHHDGFCLWPTKTTDYTVANSPHREDVIGAIAAAADRHGLKLGLYYSLWDRREKSHDVDDGAYVEYMLEHLTELLTGYGDIVELWFDGAWAKCPFDKGKTASQFMADWREQGAVRWQWDRLVAHIRRLQPGCVIVNNPTTDYRRIPLWPVDARCSEKGEGVAKDEPVWEIDGRPQYLPLEIETTISQSGPEGPFADGSWYGKSWDHSAATPEMVMGWLDDARAVDAVFLLNAGPMASGKLRPEDEALLREVGRRRGI